MEKAKRSITFSLMYIMAIEIIIHIAAALISSDGRYFAGQPSNVFLYNFTETTIRIFFMAVTVYTFAYWANISCKPRFFSLIIDNFTIIYITLSFIMLNAIGNLCF